MKILKKIYNFFSNNKLVSMTLFFATFIITYSYYVNEVVPFGKYSLLCVDFYHQYGPMTYEYVHRLLGNGSIVYSFYQGLGLPIFRNFLNYLSSPVNLLLLFFNKSNHLTGLSLVIGLKAVLSATTCAYYLKKKFKNNSILLVPLSLLYAFSAYYRAYYWNLMWIDGMVFLPLITLGIENIINNDKWKLYLVSLFIMIIANYFIAYMICIYCVIYFIVYLLYKTDYKKKFKDILLFISKKTLKFGGISLLAGALTAFLMLPMATSMASISATGSEMPTSQYYLFTLTDFIKNHLSCVNSVIFKSDPVNTPNVSAGIISIFLLFTYILNINIPKKNKICYLSIYIIFLTIIFVPQLDFIIQAFHVPNDLPYRYSFIYTFIMIIIGAYSIQNLDKESFIKLLISFVLIIGFVLIIYNEGFDNASKEAILINVIVLSIFLLFFLLGKYLKPYRSIFYFSLILVASIDCIESMNYGLQVSQIANNFYSSTEEMDRKIDYIHNYDNSQFYRIDAVYNHTLNDSAKSFYNGITTFSSMAYENMAKLQKKLGNKGNDINSYLYVIQTPVYDMMFDTKYIIGNEIDTNRYTRLNYKDDSIYQFNMSLGLAYGVYDDIFDWDYKNTSPIKVQNDYITRATHVENVFNEMTPIRKEELASDSLRLVKYTYENPKELMYLYFKTSSVSFVKIGNELYAKNDDYQNIELGPYSYNDYDDEYLISVLSEDETIEIIVGYNYYLEDSAIPYYIDSNKLNEAYEVLRNKTMAITSFNEDTITGQMYLNEDSLIYTSIPYDKGWEVYINDKRVETYSIGDALLAFNAEKGLSKIELRYRIPKFKLGLIISTISLAIVFQLLYLDKKKTIKKKS